MTSDYIVLEKRIARLRKYCHDLHAKITALKEEVARRDSDAAKRRALIEALERQTRDQRRELDRFVQEVRELRQHREHFE